MEPTLLNDRDVVIVRNYTSSATTCKGGSVTAYINSFSNVNDIDGNQTICSGETLDRLLV